VIVVCCRQYEQNEGSLGALRDATELRFAANSRTTYSLQDDVVLELFTKNMGTEVRVAYSWPVWQSGLSSRTKAVHRRLCKAPSTASP
jgi:hypothetical protein